MPIFFNDILRSAGIDPVRVRLLRHQDNRSDKDRTPYLLWRNHPADFVTYQSRQASNKRNLFGSADFWAAFVVPPTPARKPECLFASIFRVGQSRPAEIGARSVTVKGAIDSGDDICFELIKDDSLREYEGKLVIDWGSGALAWAQYAHKHEKPVVAILPESFEPEFPGYLRVMMTLAEVPNTYTAWKQRLSAAKGVYVLTCVADNALYVGSATGSGGFFERWCEHAKNGGDAIRFRDRGLQQYQVSILEVAGSNSSDSDIIRAENLWMEKLQTRLMGLNGGLLDRANGKISSDTLVSNPSWRA